MAKTSTYANINGVMPKSAKIPFTHNGQNYNMQPGYEADLRDFSGYDSTGLNDVTSTVQTAMNQLIDAGGGTLILPYIANTYKISGALQTSVSGVNPNCQLYPKLQTASGKMVHLTLRGSTPPNFASEGVEPVGRNTQGVILESTIQGTGTKPAVFGTPYTGAGIVGDRNYINVHFENLIVRTATMSGSTNIAGTMSAINFAKLNNFTFDNLKADFSSQLNTSVEPTNETYGIIMPDRSNKAMLGGGFVFVEGYKYGLVLGEHTCIRQLITAGCVYGLVVVDGVHTCSIQHYTAEVNKNNILVNNSTSYNMPLTILNYETEHDYVADTWFQFNNDIDWIAGSNPIRIVSSNILLPPSGTEAIKVNAGYSNYKILYGHGANSGL